MKKLIVIMLILFTVSTWATTIKISDLPSATNITDANLFYVVQTTSKKVTAEIVKDYVLGGAEIGGATSTDITTNNGTQSLTNKTLISPVINSTAVTATGAEINVLDGITATTAELNYCDGVTSNIQAQFNAISSLSAQPYVTYMYTTTWTQSGTTKDIEDATILTAIGDPSGVVISPIIIISVWQITTATYTIDTSVTTEYKISFTGVNHLDVINLTNLTNGVSYAIAVSFRLISDGL